jgi:hypothetical protein
MHFQDLISTLIFFLSKLNISFSDQKMGNRIDIPKVFFLISQILSSMLKINVYSIIDSKVFGVTFGVKFFFPIVE